MYYKIINKKKKVLTIISDILGYTLWTPINFFRKRDKNISPSEIRNILIVRTAYIGDVIMTLPILKPLKELYPGSKLTFLTGSKSVSILSNNPFIDEVLVYDAFWFYPADRPSYPLKEGPYPAGIKEGVRNYLRFLKVLRSKSYDLVIEARGDVRDIMLLAYLSRSRYRVSYRVGGGGYLLTHVVPFKGVRHRVDYHLDIVRYLGAKTEEIEWGINLTQEEKDTVNVLLSKEGITESDFLVGIHPVGRKELKSWRRERFAELADCIITRYRAKIIFTGSPGEEEFVTRIIKEMKEPAINLSGRTNLRILAGLIGRLNLFICNDTAPLHIASAMKTPTVAIFGPSKSRETGPYPVDMPSYPLKEGHYPADMPSYPLKEGHSGNINRVVEKNFPCRFGCDEDVCTHPVSKECMDAIQVDDVLAAVREILGEVNKKVEFNEIQN